MLQWLALNDDEESLLDVVESAVVETALESDPAADADSAREPAWLRWIKFLALMVGPAIVFGLIFLFGDYFDKNNSNNSYRQSMASKRVESDTTARMKFRFCIGASVGAGLGAIYVVRCLIRKTDP